MATVESPVQISPEQISEAIRQGWAEFLLHGQNAQSKRGYVYASGWRACERRLVLDMVEADKLPAWTADQLANFRRGQDRERDLLADLKKIGRNSSLPFDVVGEQERFELRDRKGRVVIVGKVDARLQFANRSKAPLECKAWNVNLVARIKKFEDLLLSPWTRAGAYQLLAYLFGSGEPLGFLMLDRPGIPLLLPVELDKHLDMMESFLTSAERAMDHKEAGTLPDFIEDVAECKRCAFFGGSCQPPIKSEGAQLIVDEEVLADLERWHELKEAGEEFEDLDKSIKERFRGVELAIGGPFLVTGKWKRGVKIEMTEEAKKQIDAIMAPLKKPVEKGSFTLSIVRTNSDD